MVRRVVAGVLNGNWRGWLLGIMATVVGSLIINGIAFQRETRETLARISEIEKHNDERTTNILKYLTERIEDRSASLNREIGVLDQRLTRTLELLEAVDKKVTTAPEIGRELRERDAAIQRIEKRVEELEKRR